MVGRKMITVKHKEIPADIKKYVKKAINHQDAIDMRMISAFRNAPVTFDNTGIPAIFPIWNMAQGDDIGQRQGDTVKVYGYEMRVDCQLNQANIFAGADSAIVRCILVRSKRAKGITPLWSDVMDNNASIGSSNAPNNFRNLRTFQDNVIEYDKTCVMNYYGPSEHVFKIKKRFKKPIIQRYSGVGAASFDTNQYTLMLISDQPAGAVNNFTTVVFAGYLSYTTE